MSEAPPSRPPYIHYCRFEVAVCSDEAACQCICETCDMWRDRLQAKTIEENQP